MKEFHSSSEGRHINHATNKWMATPVTTDTSFLEIRGRTDLAYILKMMGTIFHDESTCIVMINLPSKRIKSCRPSHSLSRIQLITCTSLIANARQCSVDLSVTILPALSIPDKMYQSCLICRQNFGSQLKKNLHERRLQPNRDIKRTRKMQRGGLVHTVNMLPVHHDYKFMREYEINSDYSQ
jgi:hypothetical protein